MFCFVVVPEIVLQFDHLKKESTNITDYGQCKAVMEGRLNRSASGKFSPNDILDFVTGQVI